MKDMKKNDGYTQHNKPCKIEQSVSDFFLISQKLRISNRNKM